MWYTVAKSEIVMHDGVRVIAGSVWSAKAFSVNGCAMVELTNVDEAAEVGIMNLVKTSAQDFFTKPTRSLDDAMENSFMIAERVYC